MGGGRRPGLGQRTVSEFVAGPGRGDDEAGHGRIRAKQVLAIAAVQLFEDVDLGGREALRSSLSVLGIG